MVNTNRSRITYGLRDIFECIEDENRHFRPLYCDCRPPAEERPAISINLQCAAKKVSPKVFCHFLSNRSEFLHEISHIYCSFIVT